MYLEGKIIDCGESWCLLKTLENDYKPGWPKNMLIKMCAVYIMRISTKKIRGHKEWIQQILKLLRK